LFAAPPEKDLEWSDKGVDGAFRFLNRLWGIVYKNRGNLSNAKSGITEIGVLQPSAAGLCKKTHQTVRKVTTDIEREYHFNTAIAGLMELVNEITAFEPKTEEDWTALKFSIEQIILLLSPFSPHIAEALWEATGNTPSVFDRQWPEWDEEAAKEETIELVVQVNGKVRSKMMISAGTPDDEIKRMALEDKKVRDIIGTKELKKIFIVKGKLVNIVIGN
jgi:leucyl-tRNA synthetase